MTLIALKKNNMQVGSENANPVINDIIKSLQFDIFIIGSIIGSK